MLRTSIITVVAAVCLLSLPPRGIAANVNTYQVTGPVLDVTNDMIAVQKGKGRWELGRDGSTKVDGDLKVDARSLGRSFDVRDQR